MSKPVYREWWITKFVAEGFCQICGGSSPNQREDNDIHVIEKAAYDNLKVEYRREIELHGKALERLRRNEIALINIQDEIVNLRAENLRLHNRAESYRAKLLNLTNSVEAYAQGGLIENYVCEDEDNLSDAVDEARAALQEE